MATTAPDKIRFTCAACGYRARIPAKYAGTRIKCPSCSHAQDAIPEPEDAPSTGKTVEIARVDSAAATSAGDDKFRFVCGSCGYRARMPVKYAGMAIKCPGCGKAQQANPADEAPASGGTVNIAKADLAGEGERFLFRCEACGYRARLPGSYKGARIKCPSCSHPQIAQPFGESSAPSGSTARHDKVDIAAAPPVAAAAVANPAVPPSVAPVEPKTDSRRLALAIDQEFEDDGDEGEAPEITPAGGSPVLREAPAPTPQAGALTPARANPVLPDVAPVTQPPAAGAVTEEPEPVMAQPQAGEPVLRFAEDEPAPVAAQPKPVEEEIAPRRPAGVDSARLDVLAEAQAGDAPAAVAAEPPGVDPRADEATELANLNQVPEEPEPAPRRSRAKPRPAPAAAAPQPVAADHGRGVPWLLILLLLAALGGGYAGWQWHQTQEELQRTQTDLANSQSELAATRDTLQRAENDRDSYRLERDAARERISALDEELAALKEQLQSLRDELAESQASLADTRAARDALQVQRDDSQAQLEALQAAQDALRALTNEAIEKLDTLRKAGRVPLESRVEALQQRLAPAAE